MQGIMDAQHEGQQVAAPADMRRFSDDSPHWHRLWERTDVKSSGPPDRADESRAEEVGG